MIVNRKGELYQHVIPPHKNVVTNYLSTTDSYWKDE